MDNAIPFFNYAFLRRGIVLAAAIIALWSATPASAIILMQFEGIAGESTVEGHKDWINIDSCQFGVGRNIAAPTGGGGDRTPSPPSFSEITLSKTADITTPKLMHELTSGTGKNVTLEFLTTSSGGGKLEVYQRIELENVLISGYSQSSGGDRPSESLSLNFTKITLTYMEPDAQPPKTEIFIFDLTTGTAGALPAKSFPAKTFPARSLKKAP